jgi:hypothetical protein
MAVITRGLGGPRTDCARLLRRNNEYDTCRVDGWVVDRDGPTHLLDAARHRNCRPGRSCEDHRMSTDRAKASGFIEGSTVVRRDVLDGKVWSAAPFRVITDSGGTLVMACWPGAENLASSTFTRWVRTGEDSIRKQATPSLAARRWELERFTWRDTTLSIRSTEGDYFSVCRFARPDGTSLGHDGWYVNFELPRQQTTIGYDTFDLLLDLIAEPDLSSYTWKDQDEYTHGRRLGLITDTLHSRVDQAREQVIALIKARQGPFTGDWAIQQRAPGWPALALPHDTLTAPSPL